MYDVTTDERSGPQIEALPTHGLAPFAEVRAALEVAPWSTGEPLNDEYPEAPVRAVLFGAEGQGMVTYLVLDRQRRVDILDVTWLD
jgi:hypothetical protein